MTDELAPQRPLTLADYYDHRIRTARPVIQTTVEQFTKIAHAGGMFDIGVVPHHAAATFYWGQANMLRLGDQFGPYDALPEEEAVYVGRYLRMVDWYTSLLCVYLLKICRREARHAQFPEPTPYKKWKEYALVGGLSVDIPEKMRTTTIHTCIRGYVEILQKMGFSSGLFGGPAWATIADTFQMFLKGEISPEMLCDQAFTLAHNTSPIFNKGGTFVPQDANVLKQILDIQAKGFILKEPHLYQGFLSKDFRAWGMKPSGF